MVAVAVAFFVALAMVEFVRRWFTARAVMDVPSDRSSHERPVVRGGGVGVVASVVVAVALARPSNLDGWSGAVVALFGFAALGLYEDVRRDQSVILRLAAQGGVGFAAAVLLLDGSQSSRLTKAALVVVVLGWLVGMVNVANFMDGINGISALTALVGCAAIALMALVGPADEALATVAAVVAAAHLGFLPHNFPHARIFLGDVGSYALGAAVASLVVLGTRAGISVVALVAPFVPYAADSAITLGRRVVRGERWWEPHREHAYQRLVVSGWSHARAALLVAFVTLLAGAGGVAGAQERNWVVPLVVSCLAAALYLMVPFVRPSSASTEASGHACH